ncbi:MAG: ammonium transporter [Tepidisphaeraceae bacterium]
MASTIEVDRFVFLLRCGRCRLWCSDTGGRASRGHARYRTGCHPRADAGPRPDRLQRRRNRRTHKDERLADGSDEWFRQGRRRRAVGTDGKRVDIDGTKWKPYANPDAPTTPELAKDVAKAYYSINFVWTLVAGFLVMFMQAGFALVETGLCRAKNAAHTMWMNFMVYPLGMFGFFVCGFMFLNSGANSTQIGAPGNLGGLTNNWPAVGVADGKVVNDHMLSIGDKVDTAAGTFDSGWGIAGFDTGNLFLGKTAYDGAALVLFLFMMVFMDTTATIPTGALAERWSTKSFIIFSICIGAFIYPIYGCWVWGGGWLAQLGVKAGFGHGFVDYAGSSVVHLQGGALALITCFLLGPRIGKFGADGKPRAIPGHHIPMVLLGTFILAFGWFGFNAGSSLAGTDGRIGVTAVNTMIAGTGGTMVIALLTGWFTGKFDPTMAANGMLAGLVAITAPCAFVQPWAAFTIGAMAGGLVYGSVWFVENVLKLDDPVGAISVHGVCGAFGVICVGLFSDGTYGNGWNGVGYYTYGGADGAGVTGLFYGDSGQLVAQIIGVCACTLWNVVVGGVIFFVLGKLVGNRVKENVELAGLDVPEVGVAGYPEFMDVMPPENYTAADIASAKR